MIYLWENNATNILSCISICAQIFYLSSFFLYILVERSHVYRLYFYICITYIIIWRFINHRRIFQFSVVSIHPFHVILKKEEKKNPDFGFLFIFHLKRIVRSAHPSWWRQLLKRKSLQSKIAKKTGGTIFFLVPIYRHRSYLSK